MRDGRGSNGDRSQALRARGPPRCSSHAARKCPAWKLAFPEPQVPGRLQAISLDTFSRGRSPALATLRRLLLRPAVSPHGTRSAPRIASTPSGVRFGPPAIHRALKSQGCSSLFVYCTRVLKLSEHAAYGRIEAARATRRFPRLLDWLERGDLTLTTVCLLAPHLTEANAESLFEQARGRSKRQVEDIVAALRPQLCAAATMRKLPDRSARALAIVLDRALGLLVAELERAKHASVRRPRSAIRLTKRSRHIPAVVRREVWRREGILNSVRTGPS